MNLSMRKLSVNNQLKLFDENTYPDPNFNSFQVGDLIYYENKKEPIESKTYNYIDASKDAIPKLKWDKIKVIRKYKPELFKFEIGQKVWWDGIYPGGWYTADSGITWELHSKKEYPSWVTIKSKYIHEFYGYTYHILPVYWYVYPEHLFKNRLL